MKRLVATLAVALIALTGCTPPGDTSRADVVVGASSRFSRAELQAAADSVLTDFASMRGASMSRLTYDEAQSDALRASGDSPGSGDVVFFTGRFVVGAGDGSVEPNTTNDFTWALRREGPGSPWRVTQRGVG